MKQMENKNNLQVGVTDPDRELFDELIPLPEGTSYNSYLIIGENKTALIDTVDPKNGKELLENIESKLGKFGRKIDYIITNHAEQDHSGSIPLILENYPQSKIICSTKCKDMLLDLLEINEDRIKTVEDNEELDLGNKTLRFIYTPWVHWPETMSTYLIEDKILFSCDFFGSHTSRNDIASTSDVVLQAKRYYAQIMMPFGPAVKKNLNKLSDLDIEQISPSHGPSYNDPKNIINYYTQWSSGVTTNKVVIPYVTMHGSTEKIVNILKEELITRGIKVKMFNMSKTDIGDLAAELIDANTVILATPTVLGGAHPLAGYTAFLLNALRPKIKLIGVVGSYGWASMLNEQICKMICNIPAEILNPLLIKGIPKDRKLIAEFAETIIDKHKVI
ncbi:FprA family A-type flavoprotein [Candidatus Woesearchaeota archaeon]|nr:FprA family A-type flavoprotein [Candidatus Woesearchaeota archaeon]